MCSAEEWGGGNERLAEVEGGREGGRSWKVLNFWETRRFYFHDTHLALAVSVAASDLSVCRNISVKKL